LHSAQFLLWRTAGTRPHQDGSIATTLTEGLQHRGVPLRAASFAARAAVTAYTTAWEDWVAHPDEDFGTLMRHALADLRRILNDSDAGAALE